MPTVCDESDRAQVPQFDLSFMIANAVPICRERINVTPLTPVPRFDMYPLHWRAPMNKRDMVGKIALDANITRLQATRALEAFLAGIQTTLEQGQRVTISGFGTFDISHRKARRVRKDRKSVV